MLYILSSDFTENSYMAATLPFIKQHCVIKVGFYNSENRERIQWNGTTLSPLLCWQIL